MSYARYPLSFKLKVVAEVILNEKQKGIQSMVANKYGISAYSISNWVKQHRDKVELPSVKRENESQPVEITQNKIILENEVLKSIIIQKELELKGLKNHNVLKATGTN